MSITLNTQSDIPLKTNSAVAIKTANLSKSQLEVEGQMALNLIQSATTVLQSPPVTTGSVGSIVNIKV